MGNVARVALACCAVLTVVGCGSDAVAGSPTAAPLGDAQFDPCTIPDEAIAAAGADPATKEPGIFGVDPAEWNVCGWDSGWYFLGILSTTYSLEQVRANPQSTSFENVRVGSRDAWTYYDVSDPEHDLCDVAFASPQGVIIVRADVKGSVEKQDDMCAVAVRSARNLDQSLPGN